MKTPLVTNYGTVNTDLSVITPAGKHISREMMAQYAAEARGANRIHKPFLLLVWQDAKNGKRANWENI